MDSAALGERVSDREALPAPSGRAPAADAAIVRGGRTPVTSDTTHGERHTHVLVEDQPLVAHAVAAVVDVLEVGEGPQRLGRVLLARQQVARARRFDAGSLSAVGTMI